MSVATRAELRLLHPEYDRSPALQKMVLEEAHELPIGRLRKATRRTLEAALVAASPALTAWAAQEGYIAGPPNKAQYICAAVAGFVVGWGVGNALVGITYELFAREGEIGQYLHKGYEKIREIAHR